MSTVSAGNATVMASRSPESAGPVTAKERIVSLDLLRGVALLGILPMNIQAFSMISAAYMNPTAYGDFHGANYWVWYFCHLLADEKFMSIFSMLFGAGIFLMTSHVEAAGRKPAPLHYRRMGWLILFGLMHSYLLWFGDILVCYGLCGMLAYCYRKMSPRKLIAYGVVFIAVASILFVWMAWSLPNMPVDKREFIRQGLWEPTPEMKAHELAAYRSDWLGEMGQRANDSLTGEVSGFIYLAFWRVEGCMLIGMALFKLGVFSAQRAAKLYWTFVAAAVVVGFPLIMYGVHHDIAAGWEFRQSFFIGYQYNYWASMLVSLGWVGAAMLVFQSATLRRFTKPIAAVGRMAFSNYIFDTVVCTTIFYGFGFGMFGKISRVTQIEVVMAIWSAQLILSSIWMRHFQFGPLEWLWRSLTYWKRQPFRKVPQAGAAAA